MARYKRNQREEPKNIGYASIPNDLLYWADQKDLRFFNIEKAAKGIKSYKHAVQDIAHYFNQIKTKQIRPEQKSINYFTKCWGWDWRKTLRFIVHCMESLKNLDAGFYLKKLQVLAKRQAEKIKSYVDKARGKEVQSAEPAQEKIEDDEIEKAFLDAMEEIAAVNPKAYRTKIKANLTKGDPKTLQHFRQFKEQYLANKKARELELKAKDFDYQKALKNYDLNGKGVFPGKAVDKGDYYEVWRRGQEHSVMHTDIVTKQELLEG